jgi:hypothetical protein
VFYNPFRCLYGILVKEGFTTFEGRGEYAKGFSGEISNIIRLAYPAFIALAASVMVHQPGQKQ